MGSIYLKIIQVLKGQLFDQWGLIMLELDLPHKSLELPIQNEFIYKKATKEDIKKIKSDIYPVLGDYGQYDKKYIERIGEEGILCIIALKESLVIHYFFAFESAIDSPLSRTPIDKSLIFESDSALGSQFTNPNYRGKSISIYSLSEIFQYLNKKQHLKRLLTTIHKDTLGAEMFHKRLGFTKLESLSTKSISYKLKFIVTKLFKNILD